MVRQVANGTFCIALFFAIGCKQSEPAKPEPAALAAPEPARLVGPASAPSFSLPPGQCTSMDTYRVCRLVQNNKEYITVWQGTSGLLRIEVPNAGATGGALTPFDGCECRLQGCLPMCSATVPPSG